MKIERRNLAEFTTLAVGGPAEVWTVETPADLVEATAAPYRVLGNGSNLLVADGGVPERVIRLGGVFARGTLGRPRAGATYHLTPWIGAGVLLPGLVQEAARLGLSGLEPLLGIPASVGGAVRMNAGTRFGELADVLEAVELFHDGAFHVLDPGELGFGYRTSRLPQGAIVTRVRLRLTPAPAAAIEARMAEVDAARKGQPKRKSAGCAFKNPPGDAAGRLIDAAGFKGLRVGGAMVSHEHGNFVVNTGGARAADVWKLVKRIQEELGLELEWEVWGELP
ncbi:UDP-N-acetylmuramate dehydrogenase [Oceanithermus sp.]|uniref:UDP-N-acetylmuramate dehydrogenase n=1 Tax=Oceanithermus sp. TaxID=2268145 RepID=UPI00257E3238|nr:UDP-N-acetylmuramate dehydrogenase [Oceanithermus sp.]